MNFIGNYDERVHRAICIISAFVLLNWETTFENKILTTKPGNFSQTNSHLAHTTWQKVTSTMINASEKRQSQDSLGDNRNSWNKRQFRVGFLCPISNQNWTSISFLVVVQCSLFALVSVDNRRETYTKIRRISQSNQELMLLLLLLMIMTRQKTIVQPTLVSLNHCASSWE